MPVGTEQKSENGISFTKKNYNAEPKIYFCGSAKDLKTCLKKELKGEAAWFGKVTIMIYAPGWNEDSLKRDRIGAVAESALTITSRSGSANAELGVCNDSDSEGLIETSPDSGVFYGRLKLSGMDHDMNNNGVKETGLGGTSCKNSPFDEYAKIETGRDGAITVNWEYNPENNKVVTKSFTYGWNVAKISFLEESYGIGEIVQFKFKDKDLGDIGKDKADIDFRVWSDSDMAGITVDITQDKNYKMKKPFHFMIQDHDESSGDRLFAQEGDNIYVEYTDTTLPERGPNGEAWSKSDHIDIVATTSVTSGYPYITIR
jgi:hypothetical protein